MGFMGLPELIPRMRNHPRAKNIPEQPHLSQPIPALPGGFDVPGIGGSRGNPTRAVGSGAEAASPRVGTGRSHGIPAGHWESRIIPLMVEESGHQRSQYRPHSGNGADPKEMGRIQGNRADPMEIGWIPWKWGGSHGNRGMLTPMLTPVLTPGSVPAREQLRRSRHSRTFLVESGVGELWSEMQAGTRGRGSHRRFPNPGVPLDVPLSTLSLSPPAGDRYIVADCGGGTVDLTVHQIEKPQGTLKELYKASGGMRIPIQYLFPRSGILPGPQTREGTANPGWNPKYRLGPQTRAGTSNPG